MNTHLSKYVQKAGAFLDEVAVALGDEQNTDAALRALRSVLHVLRDRLPVEESLNLLAQLPVVIKGVYADGWSMRKPNGRLRHAEEFYDEIRRYGSDAWERDFPDDDATRWAVTTVLGVVQRHLSEGEIEHIHGALPGELKKIWRAPQSMQTPWA